MPTRANLRDTRHGTIVVESWNDERKKWNCICDCGNRFVANSYRITNFISKCPICHRKGFGQRRKTHGHSIGRAGSKTYNSWRGMHDRVKNHHHYGNKWYKEKGITICERWSTFDNFLEDMGERPEGTTLDRIDNLKGYEKENCRWVPMTTQRRNRSDTVFYEYKGHKNTLAGFCEMLGLPYGSWIRDRIQKKWGIEKALETPYPVPHKGRGKGIKKTRNK